MPCGTHSSHLLPPTYNQTLWRNRQPTEGRTLKSTSIENFAREDTAVAVEPRFVQQAMPDKRTERSSKENFQHGKERRVYRRIGSCHCRKWSKQPNKPDLTESMVTRVWNRRRYLTGTSRAEIILNQNSVNQKDSSEDSEERLGPRSCWSQKSALRRIRWRLQDITWRLHIVYYLGSVHGPGVRLSPKVVRAPPGSHKDYHLRSIWLHSDHCIPVTVQVGMKNKWKSRNGSHVAPSINF